VSGAAPADFPFLVCAVVLLLAYLIGSIPFAVVVSRAFGLADPRSFGSGNPGATNVLRSGNRPAALLTLLGDAAKGAAAVLLCRAAAPWLDAPAALPAWAGAAAFLGHLYPVFLRLRGGKGVATFLGTLLALVPIVGLGTCLLWVGMAALFRYSSLASVISALCSAFALLGIAAPPGARAAVLGMSALLVWRHRRNLAQLASGTESKIGQRAAAVPPPGAAGAAVGADKPVQHPG
jgi:glycerol-3-phosphate acyltransferase PlsY